MNNFERFFPWGVIVLAGFYLLAVALPSADPEDGIHFSEFRQIPVQANGRVKPIDTFARNTLMALSGRQTFRDEKDDSQPAIKWLLDMMTCVQDWREGVRKAETLHIDDPKTLKLLGLEPRPDGLYSIKELGDKKIDALYAEAKRLQEVYKEAMQGGKDPHGKINNSDLQVVSTAVQISHYFGVHDKPTFAGETDKYPVYRIDNEEVLGLLALAPRSGFRYSREEIQPRFKKFSEEVMKIKGIAEDQRNFDQKKTIELADRIFVTQEIALLDQPRIVPTGSVLDTWKTLRGEATDTGPGGPRDPSARSLDLMLGAYAKKDVAAFNKELASYQQKLWEERPAEMGKVRFEVLFNEFEPFYQCSLLYVLVFVMACVAWVSWTGPLNRAAFWLMAATLVVHTFALLARMYLTDRWLVFVTNLYSSAVFIGWGCAALGLVLEATWKNGIGTVIGSALGALSLVIAHNLAAGGEDTLEMMRAVLDTDFWLATHVTCVTLGYTATFVAGFVGILFILRAFLTRSVDQELVKVFSQIIYGIVCFATLFSFTGTVLGGIWADQSWGRFWGWDPKENGALIIVIWNALVLHARWGGLVKQRGLAVLAVVGNIVTSWSWFGVNMLGVGLHSYGFIHGAAIALASFDFFFLAVIGIGMLPLRYWRSFASPAVAFAPKPSHENGPPRHKGQPRANKGKRSTAIR